MSLRRLVVMHDDGDEYHRMTAFLRGKVWVMLARWVDHCTGCCELGEYDSGSSRYATHPLHGCLVGFGCSECGHKGIRVNAYYVPFPKEEQIILNTRMRIRKAQGRW